MVNVKVTTKRCVSAVMAFLMKSCAATNVSVDIKAAAEGLHDFTDGPYVHNYLDYMFGDNGLSGIINLTDKDGNIISGKHRIFNGRMDRTDFSRDACPDLW